MKANFRQLFKEAIKQILLIIGSLVVGLAFFGLMLSVVEGVRGAASLENLLFFTVLGGVMISADSLLVPLYLVGLMVVKFVIKKPTLSAYSALGMVVATLSIFFELDDISFGVDDLPFYVSLLISGAAGSTFHGYFDLKNSKSANL